MRNLSARSSLADRADLRLEIGVRVRREENDRRRETLGARLPRPCERAHGRPGERREGHVEGAVATE